MIIVANYNASCMVQQYANREFVITKNVSPDVSESLCLDGNVDVISICH